MFSLLDIFILTPEMEFGIIKQSWISITGNKSQFEFSARSSKWSIVNDWKKAITEIDNYLFCICRGGRTVFALASYCGHILKGHLTTKQYGHGSLFQNLVQWGRKAGGRRVGYGSNPWPLRYRSWVRVMELRVMRSNLVQAWISFRLQFHNCSSCVCNCDDES